MNAHVTNGQNGHIVISDTTAVSGNFSVLQAINTDVVLGTIAGNGTNDSGKTIGAGGCLFGHFTSVQRASGGDLVAYYAR